MPMCRLNVCHLPVHFREQERRQRGVAGVRERLAGDLETLLAVGRFLDAQLDEGEVEAVGVEEGVLGVLGVEAFSWCEGSVLLEEEVPGGGAGLAKHQVCVWRHSHRYVFTRATV